MYNIGCYIGDVCSFTSPERTLTIKSLQQKHVYKIMNDCTPLVSIFS